MLLGDFVTENSSDYAVSILDCRIDDYFFFLIDRWTALLE